MEKYEFYFDWCIDFRKNCETLFWKFRDRPISYLEIGIWEGRSACWMLDNILIHPESKYTGIDINLQGVVNKNLESHKEKVTIYEGNSSVIIPRINEEFDIIYIDGDHSALGALTDSVLCWDKAKQFILWDDYRMFCPGNNVFEGVNSFINCLNVNQFRVAIDNYQYCIERIK
jgi:hypothetical protein